MHFNAIRQTVQAVEWTGEALSESVDWLPPTITWFKFVLTQEGTHFTICGQHAYLGNGKEHRRIDPGNEIVFENGRIVVVDRQTFQELFEPAPKVVSLTEVLTSTQGLHS
jgi:hypothetical protein